MARRREELRAKHHAALNAKRGSLRVEPTSYMKATLDRFKLSSILEGEDSRDKLASAGYRGQAPLITFMFFRFVMPFIVFGVTLFYLFLIVNPAWSSSMKLLAAFCGAAIGFYLPDIFVNNMVQRRQQSIMRGFPDALDLMLICVESGMSVEIRLYPRRYGDRRPVPGTGRGTGPHHRRTVLSARSPGGRSTTSPSVAAITASRRWPPPSIRPKNTVRPWARRCASPPMKIASSACEEAERKAASLPAKLTVPMIIFFLPCLFVVIMGPSIITISRMM